MPFRSVREMQTCFGKGLSDPNSKWDCKESLRKTKQSVSCLPTTVSVSDPKKVKQRCRPLKKNEHVIGPLLPGPRKGLYFEVDGVKVYVPKSEWARVRARLLYSKGSVVKIQS